MVYGPLLRGESKLSWDDFRRVEDFLLTRGAVVAFLWDAPTELEARMRSRGDDIVSPDLLEAISQLYEEVAWSSRLPVFRLRLPSPGDGLDVWHAARLASRGAKERFWS
jgi:hypothetical protein